MTDEPSGRHGRGAPAWGGTPLPQVPVGREVELVAVHGGRRLVHRLAEMGLARGAHFEVVRTGPIGPVIISLKGTRLMLGRGLVGRILVRTVTGD